MKNAFFLFFCFGVMGCGPVSRNQEPAPAPPEIIGIIKEFGDIVRDDPGVGKLDLLNNPILTKVTTEFGPSILVTKNLPFKSEVAKATVKPWSSWWYPKKDNDLFRDSNSALAKYDLYRKSRYKAAGRPMPKSAADFERDAYDPSSLNWEGLCDAWALASVLQREPKAAVTVKVDNQDVTFSVGDLKALLLKTYEGLDDNGLNYYGQKFTGNADGWIHPDMFPEQFHRLIEVKLFRNHQAFVMDHDPGGEVWNVPVFKANYTVDAISGSSDEVLVRMWIYTADSNQKNEKDLVGTKEVVREYNYVLKGKRDTNGDLNVTSGYWTKGPTGGDSRQDHPDYAITIPNPEKLVRKSFNPEIEVTLVDKLLSQ